MTYNEHLAEREKLKKEFSLIDYFAVNIYALEMSLSNSFAWDWYKLSLELRDYGYHIENYISVTITEE